MAAIMDMLDRLKAFFRLGVLPPAPRRLDGRSKALLDAVNAVLDEARRSGLIAQAIARSGLVGLDVAPARP